MRKMDQVPFLIDKLLMVNWVELKLTITTTTFTKITANFLSAFFPRKNVGKTNNNNHSIGSCFCFVRG